MTCIKQFIKKFWIVISLLSVLMIAIPLLITYGGLASLAITLPLLFSGLGFIFLTLKHEYDLNNFKLQHELNQQEFNLKLFDERFEIFKTINQLLWKIVGDLKVGHSDINQISGEILYRSYFLFSSETYNFISELREKIINLRALTESGNKGDEYYELVKYLGNLVTRENLLIHFKELKVYS